MSQDETIPSIYPTLQEEEVLETVDTDADHPVNHKQENPFEDDEFSFAFNQYNDLKGLDLWFKIHAIGGFSLGLLSMLSMSISLEIISFK